MLFIFIDHAKYQPYSSSLIQNYTHNNTQIQKPRATKKTTMGSPSRYGLLAVFSVSASVAVLLHHLHKRMVSDFINKLEFQIYGNCEKGQGKKKVRFAEKVIEVETEEEEGKGYERREWREGGPKLENVMPPNRAALYRGIIKNRTLHAQLRF